MTIIYARLLPDCAPGETARVVHAVRLPSDGTLPSVLTALCGAQFPPGVLENLPNLGGAPCTGCLAAFPLPTALPPKPTPYRRDEVPPQAAALPAVAGAPALGLRETQLVHRIPGRPLASILDGRTVVVTVCGVLAWVAYTEPPTAWPRCAQCHPSLPEPSADAADRGW